MFVSEVEWENLIIRIATLIKMIIILKQIGTICRAVESRDIPIKAKYTVHTRSHDVDTIR